MCQGTLVIKKCHLIMLMWKIPGNNNMNNKEVQEKNA